MKNSHVRSHISIAEQCKDLKVYHLTKPHHPNQLYSFMDHSRLNKIQQGENPSQKYQKQMKNLYVDRLQEGVKEMKKKQQNWKVQKEQLKRNYVENTKGVLPYMQKGRERRNHSMNQYLQMQERRQRYFIDEDKNKVKRNNSFVNSNLNSNAFFSECDKHQRKQAILHENMLKCNRDILFIKLQKEKINSFYAKKQIQEKQNLKLKLDRIMEDQKMQNLKSKVLYRKDLQTMVRQKKENKGRQIERRAKNHNPITNPIQYHIDNPYILRQINLKNGINND